MHSKIVVAAVATLALLGTAVAQQAGRGPGQGPVITQCKDDIAKFCAGKAHDGETRACLEAKKSQVSAACRTALDSTGPGQRQ